MPSLYTYVPPEEEYNPELSPQPVTMPDGSAYTGAAPAAPTNYVPGSTYIPPGAAESPQTAGPPPQPAYNITGGGANNSDYTGSPAPAPSLPPAGVAGDESSLPVYQYDSPDKTGLYVPAPQPTTYNPGPSSPVAPSVAVTPDTPAARAAAIAGPVAQRNPGNPMYGRTMQTTPPPPAHIVGTGGYRTGPTIATTWNPPKSTNPAGVTTKTSTSTKLTGPGARVASDPGVDSAGRDLTSPQWQALLAGVNGVPFVDADGNPTQETLDANVTDGYMIKNPDGSYAWADGTPVSKDNIIEKASAIANGTLKPVGAGAPTANGQLAANPLPSTGVDTATGTTSSGSNDNYSGGGGSGSNYSSGRSGRSYGSGGGGNYSSRSYGRHGSSSAGFDAADFNPDTDGDGKISPKEARAAKKRRGRKGRMGAGGTMMPSFPGDIRQYILGQLGEGFGRPVGGWPETGIPGTQAPKSKKKK